MSNGILETRGPLRNNLASIARLSQQRGSWVSKPRRSLGPRPAVLVLCSAQSVDERQSMDGEVEHAKALDHLSYLLDSDLANDSSRDRGNLSTEDWYYI